MSVTQLSISLVVDRPVMLLVDEEKPERLYLHETPAVSKDVLSQLRD